MSKTLKQSPQRLSALLSRAEADREQRQLVKEDTAFRSSSRGFSPVFYSVKPALLKKKKKRDRPATALAPAASAAPNLQVSALKMKMNMKRKKRLKSSSSSKAVVVINEDITGDLRESRRIALLRLIDKRRELQKKTTFVSEQDKQESLFQRVRWREGVKEKRLGHLNDQIDRNILQQVLSENPRALLSLTNESKLSDTWSALMNDLANNASSRDACDALQKEVYEDAGRRNTIYERTNMEEPPSSAATVFLRRAYRDTGLDLEFLLGSKSSGFAESKTFKNAKGGEAIAEGKGEKDAGTVEASAIKGSEHSRETDSTLHSASAHAASDADSSVSSGALCESLFLVGPSADDIENLLIACASTKVFSASKVDPKMLFVTTQDPELDAALLPYFCFPSNITVGLESTVQGSPTRARTNSSVTQAPGLAKIGTSRTIPSSSSSSSSRCFAFWLSNHLSSQYAVCLTLPRTFYDKARGISVNTEYCVCVITRFPFLGFLFHSLKQFEALGGLNLGGGLSDVPLRKQEENHPLQPELRLLNDLATRLSRLQVPFYAKSIEQVVEWSEVKDLDALVATAPMQLQYEPLLLTMAVRYHRKWEVSLRRDVMHTYFTRRNVNDGITFKSKRDKRLSNESTEEDDMREKEELEEELENERDAEACFHTLLWSLPILLHHLPLDQIILAVGCALTEMKVVVLSNDSEIVSGCLLALLHLIRPLKWAGNVVVTCPSMYSELLESPSLMLLGMHALPHGFELPEGIVVVNPHEREVKLHPKDIVASHTLNLPQSKNLINALKGYADIIKNASRNHRAGSTTSFLYGNATNSGASDGKSNSETNNSVSSETTGAAPDSASASSSSSLPQDETQINYTPLPLSADLDVESNTGKQIFKAVSAFSSIMTAHLQTLVNTAVQMEWERKRAKKKQLLSLMSAASGKQPIKKAHSMQSVYGPQKVATPNDKSTFKAIFEERLADASVGIQRVRNSLDSALNRGPEMSPLSNASPQSSASAAGLTPTTSPVPTAATSKSYASPLPNISEGTIKGSDTDESISNASLPRVMSGASIFSTKDIGAGGAKFIKRLSDTQAFSNYCHIKSLKGKKKITPESANTAPSSNAQSKSPAPPVEADEATVAATKTPTTVATTGVVAVESQVHESQTKSTTKSPVQQTARLGDEPIKLLFSIILTGTDPMNSESAEAIRLAYQNELAYENSFAADNSTVVEDLREAKSSSGDHENSILWCNGRCGGLANTSSCTNICFFLWAQRVQQVRHHHAVKSIIEKHHHSDLVLNSRVTLPTGERVSIRPRAQLVKHVRETESQFQLRIQEILNHPVGNKSSDNSLPERGLVFVLPTSAATENSNSSNNFFTETRQHSVNYTTKRGNDRGESAISQMTRYYAARRSSLRAREQSAIEVLHEPLMSFIYKLRIRHANLRTVTMQRVVRGHLSRIHSYQSLKDEEMQKLMACTNIRQWSRALSEEERLEKEQKREELFLRTQRKNTGTPTSMDTTARRRGSFASSPPLFLSTQEVSYGASRNMLSSSPKTTFADGYADERCLSPNALQQAWQSAGISSPRISRKFSNKAPPVVTAAPVPVRNSIQGILGSFFHPSKNTILKGTKSFSSPAASEASPLVMPLRRESVGSGNDISSRSKLHHQQQQQQPQPLSKSSTPVGSLSRRNSFAAAANSTAGPGSAALASPSAVPPSSDALKQNSPSMSSKMGNRRKTSSVESLSGMDVANDDEVSDVDIVFLTGPLRTLGLAARDAFTPQQRVLLLNMYSILREGVQVLKHGRKGKPNPRFLYCDAEFASLYWRAHAEDGGAGGKNTGGWGIAKADVDRVVLFRDILEVRDDIATDVMRRSFNKRLFAGSAAPTGIISIIFADRTLDFEIDQNKWASLYMPLLILTNFHRTNEID